VIFDRLTRSAAAAALLLLLNVHVKTMTVLCISDAGHIEIETAGSACCVQDAATSYPVDPQLLAAADDCGACMDVQLAQDVARLTCGIQFASSYRALSGPVPDLAHPAFASIREQDLRAPIPVFILTPGLVCPAPLSTVIRC